MNIPLNLHLPPNIEQNLQIAKDFVTHTSQELTESLQTTAAEATNNTINTVTNTLEQSKNYFQHNWIAAEQVKNAVASEIQSSITDFIDNLFTQNPSLLRLVQTLSWSVHHPIISVIVLLFLIALIGSIIKGIVKLIETASWSILQVPLKLIWKFAKLSFFSIWKMGNLAFNHQISKSQNPNTSTDLVTNLYKNKQQRLADISQRLNEIQQEQQDLLQEVAELINSDVKNNLGTIKHLIANSHGAETTD